MIAVIATRWRYRVFVEPEVTEAQAHEALRAADSDAWYLEHWLTELNRLGAEGWEAVCEISRPSDRLKILLKRPPT